MDEDDDEATGRATGVANVVPGIAQGSPEVIGDDEAEASFTAAMASMSAP